MKSYILFPLLAVIMLTGIIIWRLTSVPKLPDSVPQTVDRMFVRVNADSLAYYLQHFYAKQATINNSRGRNKFLIKYNKKEDILLHQDITMSADSTILKNEAKDLFLYKEEGDDIIIGLTNEDGFVLCPTPILARVLHEMSLTQE